MLACKFQDIPQQHNGYDCGVFACMFAEAASRRSKFLFTQEDMPSLRRRMVYEILTKKLLA
jgi:sentrin-specific protease 1